MTFHPFRNPIAEWFTLTHSQDFHSYLLLIPIISAYFLYQDRHTLPKSRHSSPRPALLLALTSLALAFLASSTHQPTLLQSSLSILCLSLLLALYALGFLFLGTPFMSAASFPITFLLFAIPIPNPLLHSLETISKLASAEVVEWLFSLSGTPFLRSENLFKLPTITIEVAQECSGIRSSWILLITSVIASHLFLKSSTHKLLVIALVFPLAIFRNAFRILILGLLCTHLGPHLIDSPIHHQGGPIFFALALLPLFLLIFTLRKFSPPTTPPTSPPTPP